MVNRNVNIFNIAGVSQKNKQETYLSVSAKSKYNKFDLVIETQIIKVRL